MHDDGESWAFLDKCPHNNSHTGSMLVGKAADAEGKYFLDQILPLLVSTILKTEVRQADRMLNRTWPWLSNHEHPFKVDDAVLLSVRKSLQQLARLDPVDFRSRVDPLKSHEHETIGYLILSSYAENPQEFANECVHYLLGHKPRLNIGYGSWSGREGHGESAVSRLAIRAVSPCCDLELERQLEDAVIGYCRLRESKSWSARIRRIATATID